VATAMGLGFIGILYEFRETNSNKVKDSNVFIDLFFIYKYPNQSD
jgi:hypothetical protein